MFLSGANELPTPKPLPCAPEYHTWLPVWSQVERNEMSTCDQNLLATASSGSHLTASSQASQVFSFSKETQEDIHIHGSDSLKSFTTTQH